MNATASRCSCQGTTLLTTVGSDGVERSVSMVDRRRLNLGRGILARTDWLRNAPGEPAGLWNLTAALHFRSLWLGDSSPLSHVPAMSGMTASLSGVPGKEDPALAESDSLLLRNTSTVWPQQMASILCMPPRTSFLRRPELVCDGFGGSKYDGKLGKRPRSLAGKSWDAPRAATWASIFWWVQRTVRSPPHVVYNATLDTFKPSPFPSASTGPPTKPLALYGAREVNSASPAEQSLAASLRRRLLYLPTLSGDMRTMQERSNMHLTWRLDKLANKAQKRMSITFDGSAFGLDAPTPPASTQDIGLAILVVLPEAVAIATVALGTRKWRRREAGTLGLLFVAGLVSLSAIISMAVQERAGADWRAATQRSAIGIRLPSDIDERPNADSMFDLVGTEVVHYETFVVVARLGFRPRMLGIIATVVSAAYMGCSAVAAAIAYRSMRAHRDEAATATAAAMAAKAEGEIEAGLLDRNAVIDGDHRISGADTTAYQWWTTIRAAFSAPFARYAREVK